MQPSLFHAPRRSAYPITAGFKVRGTSQQAAQSVKAAPLRDQVLAALRTFGPLTADECAARLGRSILAIRPRYSELFALGLIEDTGAVRTNASGKYASVWRVKP